MTSILPGAKGRPAYPPQIPPFNADVGGADPIEHAFRTQQAVHHQYGDWLAAHSRDIDPDILKTNSGAYQFSDGALALEPALAAAQAHADEAGQRVKPAVAGLTVPDDMQDQARRIWDRTKPQLDAANGTAAKAAVAQQLIAKAQGIGLATLAEELPSYFAALRALGGGPVPMDWLTDALAARVPGQDDAQADATLRARRVAVLAQNHASLTRAIANQNPPPPLYSPYSEVITAEPYRNGESWDPRNAE
ncbi:hypothetical protein [Mycobacterium asiaticum]|uniref:Uncharacterized protein n=1 Tax=Mycobacterium asiaticum TaxID=1790 RepID=A0A1A3KC56_MYCAS|nr:hypothetical protein [Mycobacterium asiaticum]OBJ81989.1 hypothetical protein A5640_21900 [Mycobacterium asiaticum]